MAGLRTASTWLKISLVAIIIALILFIVGFATVAWVVVNRVQNQWRDLSYWSVGLWEQYICRNSIGCYETGNSRELLLFHVAQAMECLGLISMVIAFVVLLLYTCSNSFRRRSYLIGNIICTFISVAFIVIGIVIFFAYYDNFYHDVGWSMGLAIAAAICAFISGIMSLLELCSR